jgi:hypothetical protein
MTTDTIKEIQKKIIIKLEAGEDVSELSRQLAQERAKIAAQAEVEELQKIAAERSKLRDKAEAVKVKVQKQGEAIDRFLELRDTIVKQLQPLVEPMRELAKMQAPSWEREPGECYLFSDIGQFAAAVQGIPEGYLPADFGCPFLEMKEGTQKADNKAVEASSYLQWCVGILSNLQKGMRTPSLKPVEGLMAIDNEPETSGTAPEPIETVETETLESEPVELVGTETICKACCHPERETIDNLLRQGKSLRDLESAFGISRSTLSRHHKNHLDTETLTEVE